MPRLILPLLLLAACQPAQTTEPLDIRRDFPEPPADSVVVEMPEWVVPAFSEMQSCYATTYEGPAVGIHAQRNYQSNFGHHLALFGTTESVRDVPDDTIWDCTDPDDLDMTAMEPIIIGGDIIQDSEGVMNEFILPDGMAAKLQQGQRIILQSHYVNASADDVLVADAMQLETVDEAEVEVWAAPLVNTITDFVIPAGEMGYNRTFDCTFDTSYTVLYLGGHMHEWGNAYGVDLTRDGVTETIYEVPDWDPVFRDAPKYRAFANGEFLTQPGDVFTTSCTWDNDEDHDLEFPQEMCVTFGMIYPATVPVICEPD